MKVFKFGGASLSSIERIRRTADIIAAEKGHKLLVVISAMGKTTNALEKVAESFFAGDQNDALALFSTIKNEHIEILEALCPATRENGKMRLVEIFTEAEWLLHDKPVREFDYYYDQIVCCGELLSSTILSHYLSEINIRNRWIDARDIVRTDDHFREGQPDWDFTGRKVSETIHPLFEQQDLVLTQGFIGCTDENESTTLGREGSDYTAAIFGNLLPAESVTIWKDVASVMNADPKLFPKAVPLTHLSYTEVIEMAYYGAQVIHPKTIKPLQNKNIPLLVKCFLDSSLPGTVISDKNQETFPPIIVIKENQALIEFKSKDFSFVEDEPVEKLHGLLSRMRMKPNLTQNAAISLLCCFDDKPEKTEKLSMEASALFDVTVRKGLQLITVRHYDNESIRMLSAGKKILLEQKTTETAQLVTAPLN